MSHPTPTAISSDPPEVPVEDIEAELQSVLRSAAFERSEKLQKFLRFICETTIRGEGGRINEYLIGSVVFLRGPEYSPSEDSVVRRQAHTLRQKLQEYYAGEGSSHALRIELPVGRYVPTFRRIKVEVAISEPVAPVEPVVLAERVEPRRTWLWPVVVAGFLLLGAGYLVGSRTAGPAVTVGPGPGVREIWGPWSQGGRPTAICFSSPMTAVIKHFDQELPADTLPKRFRARADEEEVFRRAFRLPPGGAYYFTPTVNQTKVGEAVAGVQLTTLMTRLQVPVRTTQSRFVSWEDLRGDDMILLGNNEANQWLDPLLSKAPFRLTPSEGRHQRAIVNVSPQKGEADEYTINYSSGGHEGDQEFALISMLPGIGTKQRILLISGLNAQATQAAAEYLTAEGSVAELLTRLRKDAPVHAGPWHFQAVLKTDVHDKVPTQTWLMAVRVL